LQLVDEYPTLLAWREKADLNEQRNLFVCILYILKECDSSMMIDWWTHELPSRLLTFIDIVCICADVFEYSPKVNKGGSQNAGARNTFNMAIEFENALRTLKMDKSREIVRNPKHISKNLVGTTKRRRACK
jgi:hypothetical protein